MKKAVFIALLVSACGGTGPTPATTTVTSVGTQDGIYRGAVPATFGGGDERQARLTLKSGGEASVQGIFYEPPSRFFAQGRWTASGDLIVIDLDGAPPQRLVFARSGQQLAPREWERAVWGEKGPPVLYQLVRPTVTE